MSSGTANCGFAFAFGFGFAPSTAFAFAFGFLPPLVVGGVVPGVLGFAKVGLSMIFLAMPGSTLALTVIFFSEPVVVSSACVVPTRTKYSILDSSCGASGQGRHLGTASNAKWPNRGATPQTNLYADPRRKAPKQGV
eukprot:15476310-Alexandrium_andersonii.AAC.1